MTNQIQNSNDPERQANGAGKKKYDLIERTAKFGENVIEFCAGLSNSPVIRPLVSQLVRSGTNVGANYLTLIFSSILMKK